MELKETGWQLGKNYCIILKVNLFSMFNTLIFPRFFEDTIRKWEGLFKKTWNAAALTLSGLAMYG
jgi:hypothetical protein